MTVSPSDRHYGRGLAAALVCLLAFAGCASPGLSGDGASGASGADPTMARAGAPGETPAPVPPPAGSTTPETLSPPVPIDPVRPDVPLDLNDSAARADLWARVRRGFAMPDLDGDLVRDREQWYAARPDYVQRMTERGGRYLFHIVEELTARGMPTELALLPFIESAFNPQAMSTAKASGMWQFIPSTGKDFALKQNIFRDDRRDVLASTRAALDYLQKLHGMFGDWHLALAAYNWGEGSVGRAIARNQKLGLPTDYASLKMPNETQYYVPKLQAVKNIVSRPADFNLTLPAMANHPYFLSVPIERDMDVAVAARLAGLSLADFQNLNPQMNKPVILAAGTPQVLLPYDNADRFVHALPRHAGPLASWTAWVAPKTMRSAEAAREVGMDEDELRAVNKIPPRMLIKAGSTLLVPRVEHRHADVSGDLADNATMALAPDVPPLRKVSFQAGRRDTVASIARRYRLSRSQVAQWNNLGTGSAFKPGQAIVVYLAAARVPRFKPIPVAASTADRRGATGRPSTADSPVRRAGSVAAARPVAKPTAKASTSPAAKAPARAASRVAAPPARATAAKAAAAPKRGDRPTMRVAKGD